MNDSKPTPTVRCNQAGSDATPAVNVEGVALDGLRLRRAIEQRVLGGIPELRARWTENAAKRGEGDGEPPHRATIHRWLKGQMPRTSADFLTLCGLLDLDPISLLNIPSAALDRMVRTYVARRWDPPALDFVDGFLGRRSEWPPTALAREYFGRTWFVQEATHTARQRTNYYATLRIALQDVALPEGPFVYHVAFRHTDLFGKRWLQYGWVLRDNRFVQLRHVNGHADMCEVPHPDSHVRFQTWFGPGAAVFRVASLHSFSMSVEDSEVFDSPVVRFPG